MKRIKVLSCICVLSLLITQIPCTFNAEAAAPNELNFSYSFGSVNFTSGEYGSMVELDDLEGINERGCPDLPMKAVSFVIPAGKTIDSVYVTTGKNNLYENILIAPSQGYLPITEIETEAEENEDTDSVSDNEVSGDENPGEIQEDESQKIENGQDNVEVNTELNISEEDESEEDSEEEGLEKKADNSWLLNAAKANGLKGKLDFSNSSRYNASVYSGAQQYPAKNYYFSGVQTIRGFQTGTVVLYPMTYRGTTLNYTADMDITVTLKDAKIKKGYVPSQSDVEFLTEELAKDQNISSYYSASEDVGKTIAGKGQVDYLIITNTLLKNTFSKLAQYKADKGLITAVVTTEEIYTLYKGRDKAEQIRNFLIDAFQKNRIKYVLLGGDGDGNANSSSAIVPSRVLYCAPVTEGTTTQVASDMYYACLDGDYDGNQNGVFGEPTDGIDGGDIDYGYDIFVGRAPVDNIKEANNFITKTINYEKREKTKKALMIGEKLQDNYECSVELAADLQSSVEAEAMTNTFRALRDSKIKQDYVSMYYDLNDTLQRMFTENIDLLGQFTILLLEHRDSISNYLNNKDSNIALTKGQLGEVYSFLETMDECINQGGYPKNDVKAIHNEIQYMKIYISQCKDKTLREAIEDSKYYSGGTALALDSFEKLATVYGGDYKDEIKKGAKTNDMKTKGLLNYKYKVDTLYDRDSKKNKWATKTLLKKLNASPELINHMGHSDNLNVMRLKQSDIRKLKNKKAFFFYSQGCYAGSFDNMNTKDGYIKTDSIAEELITASPRSGAFACVVNSRYGWFVSSGTKGPSQIYDRWFWHYMLTSKNKSMGVLLSKSKQNTVKYLTDADNGTVIRFCMYTINLLGDPETQLGTTVYNVKKPSSISIVSKKKQAVIKWKAVKGVDGYEVFRATSAKGAFKRVAGVRGANRTSYINKKLKSKATYYYKVRAYKKMTSGKMYSNYTKAVKAKIK